MDLIETTFKVIENKVITQENVSAFKDNLNQHEHYINHLKDILEQVQTITTEHAALLKINNLSKNAFNEDFKGAKTLCGLIYGYMQQIEENVENLFQRENTLNDLYKENHEHMKKLDVAIINALKIKEEEKVNVCAKFREEFKKIQAELNFIHSEQHVSEELCENLIEQQQNQQSTLQSLKLETELLDEKLEFENEEMEKIQEENDYSKKVVHAINKNTEIKDKVLLAEESLLSSLENFKELLKQKNQVLQKQNESSEMLKHLNEQSSSIEEQINDFENKQKTLVENFTSRIDEKNELLKQNQNFFMTNQIKISEAKEEIKQIRAMQISVEEKLAILQQIFEAEENKLQESINLELLDAEHETLLKDLKKILDFISEKENNIKTKQQELAILKSPNQELIELKDKLQALEKDFESSSMQTEIRDIELRNKNLQTNIEHYETTLKELTFQNLKLELDLKENEEKLKVLILKCDNKEKEIQRLATAKQESVNLFPKPSLKHQETQPKKRAAEDIESDSSVDGEKLSYAEFMAKKRTMREKQRQKRMERSSDRLKHT